MNTADKDYVGEKTRRIVGRDALRRASRLIQNWQVQEQEDARLARRFSVGLAVALLVGLAYFFLH